ncbi:MAG: helix-turn-helix transcriptional regulator [Clostridiales bacterium]|nr:helix-turn-helix transcriptional regulator [Clostridiales bacterium]
MCSLQEIQLRLREVIKSSGIPQKEIALAIGVSYQTVSKYMCDNVFPALDTFARLCKYLDVKSDYVLGISNY